MYQTVVPPTLTAKMSKTADSKYLLSFLPPHPKYCAKKISFSSSMQAGCAPCAQLQTSLLRFLSSNNKSRTSAVFHFPRERELCIFYIIFLTSRRAQFPNLNPSNFCIFLFLGSFYLFFLFHLGERFPGSCFSLNCVLGETIQPSHVIYALTKQAKKKKQKTPKPIISGSEIDFLLAYKKATHFQLLGFGDSLVH